MCVACEYVMLHAFVLELKCRSNVLELYMRHWYIFESCVNVCRGGGGLYEYACVCVNQNGMCFFLSGCCIYCMF